MKYLEVRDAGTFIPVAAFHPSELAFAAISAFALSEPERVRVVGYGLSRSGYSIVGGEPSTVVVVRLDAVDAKSDPYSWPGSSRTMRAAHEAIVRRWDELRSGDVVDVEFFLGEKPTKKRSEAINESSKPGFRYRTKFRPPDFCTVPAGWRLVERGTENFFERRTDLPAGKFRFGVIEYDHQLEEKDVEAFQLEYLGCVWS